MTHHVRIGYPRFGRDVGLLRPQRLPWRQNMRILRLGPLGLFHLAAGRKPPRHSSG